MTWQTLLLYNLNLSIRLEEHRQAEHERCARLLQRHWRMRQFRKSLGRLQAEVRQRQYQSDLLATTIVCQRLYRYKRFKRGLGHLRARRQLELEHQARVLDATILCQKLYRYKQFRLNLARLRQEKQTRMELIHKSATIIQKQWRMYKFRLYMCLYRKSALTIQLWVRAAGFGARLRFLKLKRLVTRIQRKSRLHLAKRQHAAALIQSTFRMHRQRSRFLRLKHAAVLIQSWLRSKRERIQFLKLKRSVSRVQLAARALIRKRIEAGRLASAVKIQRWLRSMRPRFDFLKIRRSTLLLQCLYRIINS